MSYEANEAVRDGQRIWHTAISERRLCRYSYTPGFRVVPHGFTPGCRTRLVEEHVQCLGRLFSLHFGMLPDCTRVLGALWTPRQGHREPLGRSMHSENLSSHESDIALFIQVCRRLHIWYVGLRTGLELFKGAVISSLVNLAFLAGSIASEMSSSEYQRAGCLSRFNGTSRVSNVSVQLSASIILSLLR